MMNKQCIKIVMLTILLLVSICTQAQKVPQVRIIARADSLGGIQLRWAATNASAWKRCNQYGFKLVRYTVLRNKRLLEKPERKLIGEGIKPKPLDGWKTLAETNSYAAIIAQALYGKDFDVSNVDTKGITKIIAQSQEQEQRFGFSLHAADMSFEAAKLAGWGLVDTETKRDEKYLYRIITAAPAHVLKPDTASVFISPAAYEPLPEVDDVTAQFGNRTVMLSWDYSRLASYYTSYFISKSTDGGKTFKRLDGIPVSNLNDQDDKPSQRMYFMDSLSNNTIEYQYRVCGVNSFGEEGPFSTPVIGQGRDVLAFVPGIETAFIDDDDTLKINWSFEEQANILIKGFVINRSDRANGIYRVFTDTLVAIQRNLSLKKVLDATSYITVTAIPKHGDGRTSFPALVQVIDRIPPGTPFGLKARVDTNGIVTLKWNPNTEKDIMGYKVYQALKEGEDLVPLTDSVWLVNTFRDTLNLKLLNKKAWYGVSALDKRFNQSAVSALVEVKKPSLIPPSPAVFTKYETKRDSVILHWINSMDEDIVMHSLQRKLISDSTFTEVLQYPKRKNNIYTDMHLQGGKRYIYCIQAKNESGLITPSSLLELSIPASAGPVKEITRLFAYPQKDQKRIQIVWEDQLPDVAEYRIYRSTKGSPFALWKSIDPPQKGVYDTDVQLNTEYEYAVMATLQSGAYSSMKKVTAKF